MDIQEQLSAVLKERAKNAPPKEKEDWGMLYEQGKRQDIMASLVRETWDMYFALLTLEVENDSKLAQSKGVQTSKNSTELLSKQAANQRRQFLKTTKKFIGHWPTIDDALAQLFVAEVPADVIQFIAYDLKRLQEPVIRRRSSTEVLNATIEKRLQKNAK